MINTMAETVDGWYSKLNGAISVPVYIESVPEDYLGDFVLLRAESELNTPNKGYFGSNSIVIVDIVTVFQNMINTRTVDEIDGQIKALVLPNVGAHGLSVSGFQISNITADSSSYLQEDDGQRKIYRKIIRYNHLINE